jgi:hypothetical protein
MRKWPSQGSGARPTRPRAQTDTGQGRPIVVFWRGADEKNRPLIEEREMILFLPLRKLSPGQLSVAAHGNGR